MQADAPTPDSQLLSLDELEPGRTFDLGSRTLSAEEIISFATAWDPMPFHLDEHAAENSQFGGLVASGLHTVAVLVRMASEHVVSRSDVVAGRGMQDVQMRKPVRPGMRLDGRCVIGSRQVRQDGTGTVELHLTLHDDRGDLVLSMRGDMKVRRRAADVVG
jgi:acyl dehydratase